MSRIALMLYSVRKASAEDFEATLRQVAALGYEGVELFDLHGHDPEVVAGWLQELGLVAVGRHAWLETIETQLTSWPPRRRCSAGGAWSISWVDPSKLDDATLARIAKAAAAAAARGSSSGTTTTMPRSSRGSSNGSPRESSSSWMRAGPGTPGPTRSRSSDAGPCCT